MKALGRRARESVNGKGPHIDHKGLAWQRAQARIAKDLEARETGRIQSRTVRATDRFAVHTEPEPQPAIKREIDGGTRSSVRNGYVYIITNPAFDGWIKIGSTFDLEKRLASYQTSDPMRRFRLAHHRLVEDRKATEAKLHTLFAGLTENQNEWFRAEIMQAVLLFDNVVNESNRALIQK